MMYGESCPCYQCEQRTPTCHGHNPDGTWKCKRWEEMQEREAAKEQSKRNFVMCAEYRRQTKNRAIIRKFKTSR